MPGYDPKRKRRNNQRRQRAQHNVTPARIQAITPPVTHITTATSTEARRALSFGRVCGWIVCILVLIAVLGANEWKEETDYGMATGETGPVDCESRSGFEDTRSCR